jgi:hypothetical protein
LTVTEGALVALDDLYNVDEDSSNVLDVLTNDTNETGSSVTITAVGATNHGGVVTIASDGQSLNYEPADDFFGEEEFTYTISADGQESTALVTVQVFPKNDAPTANDDDFTIASDSEDNFLNVLGNDVIAPDQNETLRVTNVGTPAHGTVVIAPNGTHLLYTPDPGFAGTDTFTYTIADRTGSDALTSQATLTVTIDDIPRPAAVDDDDTVIDEDSGAIVIDVLDNDTPEQDGAGLQITSVSATTGGGQVVISGDKQTVTYTPAANFYGTDTFTYTVKEDGGGTDQATVTVTVNNVNDPPTAGNDEFDVVKDSGMTVLDVLDNDSVLPDPDGILTITAVTQGSDGGIVEIANDGRSIEYTHDGYEGTETFTYTIDDGSGETAVATVTVHVLQYTPRSLGGSALLSRRGVLGGVNLDLAGTSDFDSNVQLAYATALSGDYLFSELAPGSYTVQTHSLAFLIDSTVMEKAVQSELDDGDTFGVDFEYPGRKAQHMSLSDMLITAPNQSPLSVAHSVVVAIEPGDTQLWYLHQSGWDDYIQGSFELSEDLTEITITATESDGDQVRGTVDASDANLVRWLAREGDAYLLRITASPSEIDFQPVVDAAAQGDGEAEGEGPSSLQAAIGSDAQPSASRRASTVTTTLDDTAGEGEANVESAVSPAVSPIVPLTVDPLDAELAVSGAPESEAVDVAWFAGLPGNVSTTETVHSTAPSSMQTTSAESDDRIAAIDAVITESVFGYDDTSSVWEVDQSADERESLESAVDAALAEESLWVLV